MSETLEPSIPPSSKQNRFGFIFCFLYFACFAFALVLLALKWPIHPPDTDLWYHLTSGRYFFETGRMPNHSFFSFVAPVREGISYFWGFQVLVYWIFDHWGSMGLIALRGLTLSTLLAALYALVLFKGSRKHPFAVLAVIGGIIPLVFVTRFVLIRPHVFTFIFLALFLLILETGHRKRWLLPLLAVVWMNLHGIAYPLMYWVLFAYAMDQWHDRIRQRIPVRKTLLALAPILATLATPLMTPHGLRLLAVPWESTANASSYISEMAPPTFSQLFSFHFVELGPTTNTAYSLMLLIGLISLILSLYKRPVRLSHWILLAGSLLLIQKGVRFRTESALMLLPLILDNPLISKESFAKLFTNRRSPYYPLTLLITGLLITLPYCFVFRETKIKLPAYPESRINSPFGTVKFLNQIGHTGNVLNHPDTGGYVQWMLYPRYKIFMDMKIPFLYKDEDMFIAMHLYSTPSLFDRFAKEHNILCVLAPSEVYSYADSFFLDTHHVYKLVFFDDVEALYCDKTRMPEIIDEYEIKHFIPREIFNHPLELHLEEKRDHASMLAEAQRLLAVDPGIENANTLAIHVHLLEKNFSGVLPHADALIAHYPNAAQGYGYKIDALFGLGDPDAVLRAHRQKTARANESITSAQTAKVAAAHLKKGNAAEAYDLFNSIPFFSAHNPFEQTYTYALAAEQAGHVEQAVELYGYAELLRPTDEKMSRRADDYLKFLGLSLEAAFRDLDKRYMKSEN